MVSYRICPSCKAWVWFDDRHTCPPIWVVAPEDDPQNMRSVHAGNAEEAAIKWAEAYDSDDCEYYLAKGNEMVVLVGKPDGDIFRVAVEGKTVPSYRARELGPAPIPAKLDANSPSGEAASASAPATDEPKSSTPTVQTEGG